MRLLLLALMAAAAGHAASTQHYNVTGTIDVFTDENTLFYWKGVMYIIENIPCKYQEHAGIWQPEYRNHSYARIRELQSGRVVHNISSSIGWGFISAFTDYEHDRVWLFGTHADRCQKGPSGHHLELVRSWWSAGPPGAQLTAWDTAPAFACNATHNVQVTKVGPLGSARAPPMPPGGVLPPHRYAMMLEPFQWAINNNADGNLTHGWQYLSSTPPQNVHRGGPSMRYSPADGYYYVLTGGHTVSLVRTKDFHSWTESTPSPFISPTPADAQVSPFANFAAEASTMKGSPPRTDDPSTEKHEPFVPAWRDHPSAWDRCSNDADICCMHPDVKDSYVIWGASTQGKPPDSPLTGHDAGVNVVGVRRGMPLTELLASYFP